jgi:peptidoglycan/xylan/chitin deacetylase (PgdA/CDA1 family)/CelD/BcsL family acetyltransferase involved in cellulose biosynthesis
MKLLELREEADLEQLRDGWNPLLRRSASETIFLTWEWISSWWHAYGKRGELRIVAAFDGQGELRGIAPLRCQNVHRYGQTVPAVSFLGDGSIGSAFNDSDYLDFIVERDYEKPVMESFFRHWLSTGDAAAVWMFNEIPGRSANLAVLRELCQSRKMHWAASTAACATVRLPGSWEEYLQVLQPRFRTKIRSVLRNLESRQEVRFGFCEDARALDRLLPALFDLHTRRWACEGKPGVFGASGKREFYVRLSRVLMERQWLRFSYLEWKGQVLACQYGFAYNGVYSQLQEGYEPASEHWNLGAGLRAWSIREFLKEGLREYDFLGGVNRHKRDWGAEVKYSQRIAAAHKSYRNLFALCGPQWELGLRESIRKILPDKLLEARGNINGGRYVGAGRGWARQLAAGCYLHGGGPWFAGRLRKRYQLSVPNGHGGKLSLAKRKKGTARIFYYHRVNDDNDSFFEAMPARIFDQQMRYLARHYKVASLEEILRHLEDGESPETLVGITFDDGYRDNYENAFPILERYQIPATIFLTTGPMDSGEPLWFEQLAEAIQKTTREYLDLEIDVPRRYPMRTVEERLRSNNQIFGLLRTLENEERNQRLKEILKLLGAHESERKNKMLTWDQVRSMKAGRIDFGGHTVTHPFLSKLKPSDAVWEVSQSKQRIEEELQREVRYFAYPNGREEDFDASQPELLRAAGYQAAMTTLWGINDRSTDRMQLRRGGPWETSAALFASKLDFYQLANR